MNHWTRVDVINQPALLQHRVIAQSGRDLLVDLHIRVVPVLPVAQEQGPNMAMETPSEEGKDGSSRWGEATDQP